MTINIKEKDKNYFEKLRVWQEAHELTLDVYKQINKFPKIERYNLTDQLRRAIVSVPNNIAEGTGRKSSKDLLRFLYIARGSLKEVNYLLILARDLGYMEMKSYNYLSKKANSVGRLLTAFIKSIK